MRDLLNSPLEAWIGIHGSEKHVCQKFQFYSISPGFTMSNFKTICGVRSLIRINFMSKDISYVRV